MYVLSLQMNELCPGMDISRAAGGGRGSGVDDSFHMPTDIDITYMYRISSFRAVRYSLNFPSA